MATLEGKRCFTLSVFSPLRSATRSKTRPSGERVGPAGRRVPSVVAYGKDAMIGLVLVFAYVLVQGGVLVALGARRDRLSPLSRDFWTA
jgi:hypothetical protein